MPFADLKQRREWLRLYRIRNREKIRQWGRNYSARHRERLRERGRQYYRANLSKIKAYNKKTRKRKLEWMRQWRKRNRERIKAYRRRRASVPEVRKLRRASYLRHRRTLIEKSREQYRQHRREAIRLQLNWYHLGLRHPPREMAEVLNLHRKLKKEVERHA